MIYSFRNPVFSSENNTSIDCIINHPVYGEIPYTASSSDVEPSGRQMFNYILSLGNISPFVPKEQNQNAAGVQKLA